MSRCQKKRSPIYTSPDHQSSFFLLPLSTSNSRADGKGKTGYNGVKLKEVSRKVTVDEKGIKDSWKEYMEKQMNEENEWHHRISAGVKEGPAGCIRIDEVAAALKKMKRQSCRLVRASSRMMQTAGDIGTQWILHLCNGIVKESCIPEDWKSSVVLLICKGKGDAMECGSYRGIKLFEHAVKVVERMFKTEFGTKSI